MKANSETQKDERFKLIFDHFRNMLISATVTAIGIYSYKSFSVETDRFNMIIGVLVAFLGLGLFTFNFTYLYNKLEKMVPDRNKWLIALIAPAYFLVGSFIYQAVWKQQLT